MKYGYVRVTKHEEAEDVQTEAIQAFGVDEIYEEWPGKHRSRRTQLSELMDKLRVGDTLIIWRLDRLGKTIKPLIVMAEDFLQRGIHFVSIREQLDSSTEMGQHVIHMFCELGHMEREVMGERTTIGKQHARDKGRAAGRKPIAQKQIEIAMKMYFSNQNTMEEIIKATGLSKSSIYNYVRKTAKSTQGE